MELNNYTSVIYVSTYPLIFHNVATNKTMDY